MDEYKELIPNEETIKAMEVTRRGEFESEGTLDEFLKELND